MSAALPLWSLLVAAGVVEIVRYDTPFDPSPALAVWPRESEIRAAPYGTTIIHAQTQGSLDMPVFGCEFEAS